MADTFRAKPLLQLAWNDPNEFTKPSVHQYYRALDIENRRSWEYDWSGESDKSNFYVSPFVLDDDLLNGIPYPSIWYSSHLKGFLMAGHVKDANNTLTSDYTLPDYGGGNYRKNLAGGTVGSNSEYIWRVYADMSDADIHGSNYFYEGLGNSRKTGEAGTIVYGNSNPAVPDEFNPADHVRSDFAPGYEWHKDDCFAIRYNKWASPKDWDTEANPPRFTVGLPGGNIWIGVLNGQDYIIWKRVIYWDHNTDPPTIQGVEYAVVASGSMNPGWRWAWYKEHQFCVWFVNHSNKVSPRGNQSNNDVGKTLLITTEPNMRNPASSHEAIAYTDPELDTLIDETKPFFVYGVGGSYQFSWHPLEFSQSCYILAPWTALSEVPVIGNEPHVKTLLISNPEGGNNPTTEVYPDGEGALVGGWDTAKPTLIESNDPVLATSPATIECERTPDPNGPYGFRWAVRMVASEEQHTSGVTPLRRYRTPVLFGVEIKAEPSRRVAWDAVSLPTISDDEVVSVSGVDLISGGSSTQISISFRNRDGRWNAYDGAHEFYLDVNWLLSDNTTLTGPETHLVEPGWTMFRRFTGYLWSPQFSRSPEGEAVVTLTAVGRDQVLSDEICIGTPFYDGICSLWAVWDLAVRANFSNDQILLYQDPRNPSDNLRMIDMYAGADDAAKEAAFTAVCGEGHCNHRVLDYGAWQGEPIFLFDDGLPIIQAIDKIAQSGGEWYFINNYGNLIYLSPHSKPDSIDIATAPYSQIQKTFKEVPDFWESGTILGYNEVRKNLNVGVPMERRRNSFYVQGINFDEYYKGLREGYHAPPRPISALYKEDLNVPTIHRMPWHRWAIKADPSLVKHKQVNRYFNWLMRAGTRRQMPVSFSGWFHPDLYWLDGIYVQEEFQEPGSGVVGQTSIGTLDNNRAPLLIESVQWEIDMNSLEATMTVEGEVIWDGDELLWTTFV